MKFKEMTKFWKVFTIVATVAAIVFFGLSIWYFMTTIFPMFSVMM